MASLLDSHPLSDSKTSIPFLFIYFSCLNRICVDSCSGVFLFFSQILHFDVHSRFDLHASPFSILLLDFATQFSFSPLRFVSISFLDFVF